MTSGNNTAFVWSWLDVVERRRVDITVLHRVLLGHPHERMRLDQHGEFTARTGLPWAPPLRSDPLAMAGGSKGPFFLEVREVDIHAGIAPGTGWFGGPWRPPRPLLAVERLFAEFAARPYVADPGRGLVAQYRAVEAALERSDEGRSRRRADRVRLLRAPRGTGLLGTTAVNSPSAATLGVAHAPGSPPIWPSPPWRVSFRWETSRSV